MFMRLHCDCICLKTVESVADFNQFWQSFQGYPTFASSVNIRYLNRVKRDTFNTLMREEGEIRKERQDQKEKRRQRKALVLLDVSIFAALSLLLASGNPACTLQLKSSTWTSHLAKHSYSEQHKDTWTFCSGVPCAWTSMDWGETKAWKIRKLEENTFDFFM